MIGAEILIGKESEMKLKETGIGLRIEVVIVQRIEEESQVSSQVCFCPDVTLNLGARLALLCLKLDTTLITLITHF